MKTIYRNKNYKIYSKLFLIFIFSILILLLHLFNIINEPVMFIFSFFVIFLFIANSTFNSALFHKIIIDENTIEIVDFMPVLHIKLPNRQLVEIDSIEEIFWSKYDMIASIKKSRITINKNSMSYEYILSKNPRITKFLVLKTAESKNSYMRYFKCLSREDQSEILNYIKLKNKKIKFRFGNGELIFYKLKDSV